MKTARVQEKAESGEWRAKSGKRRAKITGQRATRSEAKIPLRRESNKLIGDWESVIRDM